MKEIQQGNLLGWCMMIAAAAILGLIFILWYLYLYFITNTKVTNVKEIQQGNLLGWCMMIAAAAILGRRESA